MTEAFQQPEVQSSAALVKAPDHQGGVIGVVIPAFGHPQFLSEAIDDLVNQSVASRLRIVIVDDGCHYAETGQVARNAMASNQIFYIRQKNKRLPGARNAGVGFLLAAFPEMEAIFFLDADNRLSSFALESYEQALMRNPGAGWAYPDIAFFGLSWGSEGFDLRETAPHYSVLKHLMGNISEAGSMVRAEVFRAGVFFDEDMRSGYEDWDFWLSALEAGFTGVRADHSGFFYRRRPESMLAESRRMEEDLIARLKRKHKKLFGLQSILHILHRESALYAFINPQTGDVRLTADPLAEGNRLSLSDFVQHLQRIEADPKEYFAPFLILAGPDVDNLTSSNSLFLRELLWTLAEQRGKTYNHVLKIQDGGRMVLMPDDISSKPDAGGIVCYSAKSLLVAARDLAQDTQEIALPVLQLLCPGYRSKGTLPGTHSSGWLTDFLADVAKALKGQRPVFTHQDRRYAGPDARELQSYMFDSLSGFDDRIPYPMLAPAMPLALLSVDMDQLVNPVFFDALCDYMRSLGQKGIALRLGLECDLQQDVPKQLHHSFDGLVGDCVRIVRQKDTGEYRSYLGRRLNVDFSLRDKEEALMRCQTADAVICIGASALQSLLGELKQYDVLGFVLAEPPFIENSPQDGDHIARLLAYEHAEKAIVSGHQPTIAALSSEGVPPEKMVDEDAMVAMLKAAYKARQL